MIINYVKNKAIGYKNRFRQLMEKEENKKLYNGVDYTKVEL